MNEPPEQSSCAFRPYLLSSLPLHRESRPKVCSEPGYSLGETMDATLVFGVPDVVDTWRFDSFMTAALLIQRGIEVNGLVAAAPDVVCPAARREPGLARSSAVIRDLRLGQNNSVQMGGTDRGP